MQKITQNFWCAGNAREVAEYYVSVFPGSKITGGSKYPASQADGLADFQLDLAGKDLTIDLTLAGHDFTLINAGPEFSPNASISTMVNFDPAHDDQAREHLDQVWDKLIDGGKALIEIGEHPFSKRYGWVQDKYGFSWQLILTNPEGDERPCMIPSLLFGNAAQNRANEAIDYYVSTFSDSERGNSYPYGQEQGPALPDSLMFADFKLGGQWFAAMDSAVEQTATFNEAISLAVVCKDQEEIDYLWGKLSAVPESEQCGWCKDKFGVSWQIVPENMGELMQKPGAFQTMMAQHKIVIDEY